MTTSAHAATLADIVRKFNTLSLTEIMSCFTEDVIARYNGDAIEGHAALGDFLGRRYVDISDYSLKKTIRVAQGNVLGIDAVARYTRTSGGERVTSLIHEILELREGRISRWDYVGHVRPDHSPHSYEI